MKFRHITLQYKMEVAKEASEMLGYIIGYMMLCQLLNRFISKSVAVIHIVDTIVYSHIVMNVGLLPNNDIDTKHYLRMFASTMIGSVIWMQSLPLLLIIHHVLSSGYIIFFIMMPSYELERQLTLYYCVWVMGLDIFELMGLTCYRLGYNATSYLHIVGYFDLATKLYGNISLIYFIASRSSHDEQHQNSAHYSYALIAIMIPIQYYANYHLRTRIWKLDNTCNG